MHPKYLSLFSLLLLLTSFLESGESVVRKGKDHAVFFAVQDYAHWDDLRTPIKDAEAIAGLLEEQYGFTTEVLKNPGRLEIRDKIIALQNERYNQDDQLLLFFTGHGEFVPSSSDPEKGRGYFIPSDAKKNDTYRDSYLFYPDIKLDIDDIDCEHILIMIDACFSGSFLQYRDGDERPGKISDRDKLINACMEKRCRKGITSGGFERTKDGIDHSPFTDRVLTALNTLGGHDRILTYNELFTGLEGLSPQPRRGYFGSEDSDSKFLFIAQSKKRQSASSNDRDSDGIPNTQDDCPDEYGTAKAKGCPDWDNDGIPNKSDDCPSTFGLASLNGCPAPADSDQDGIPDNADQCPDKYGPKQLQGCPDADGDNIPDKDDDCPNEKGIFANNGCPEVITSDITSSITVAQGTFMDSRDGQSYSYKTMKDGKKWMTQNLNYAISDSWCYDEKDSNCRKYGRLYNWAAAKKTCPSGWRLPSDQEWRAMAKYYGGCDDDASDGGKMAYKTLISGGNSGFAALFSGNRSTDGSFRNLGKYGFYWSSTEIDASYAWFYSFDKSNSLLSRHYVTKAVGRSCRCIQD